MGRPDLCRERRVPGLGLPPVSPREKIRIAVCAGTQKSALKMLIRRTEPSVAIDPIGIEIGRLGYASKSIKSGINPGRTYGCCGYVAHVQKWAVRRLFVA
jgi:hypothetical protein